MSRDLARWIIAGAVLVLVAVAGSLVACGDRDEGGAEQAGLEEELVLPGAEGWDVSLYFPDGSTALVREQRTVSLVPKIGTDTEGGTSGAIAARGLALVGALLTGPEGESLLPAVPGEISVENFDVSEDGVAYVDLGGAPPRLGTRGELLAVYSLVNTVVLNLASVESVVLLWNGTQRDTFAGHIDTTRSLKPRPQMIRDS